VPDGGSSLGLAKLILRFDDGSEHRIVYRFR
jgi:hypothetical protein